MRALAIIMIVAVVLAAVFQLDHYEWFQQPRDESNIRQQFHLPDEAAFLHFESSVKSLIPEGLRIDAVVQLSETEFKTYLAKLDDAQTWKPVALVSYSPDIATSYSPQALKWNDLPLPAPLAATLKRIGRSAPQATTIKKGKYFCSILSMVRAGRFENNPNAFKYETIGRSCAELEQDAWPVVLVLGILDLETRRLHASIGFSG